MGSFSRHSVRETVTGITMTPRLLSRVFTAISGRIGCAILCVLCIPAANAATGNNTGRVHTLLWYEGHSGLLVRQDGMTDLGGCGRSDYFILDTQHVYFKEIYAMLLSAHLSDLPVQITVTDFVEGISRIRHVQIAR
jgi:hypothetical protein